MANFLLEMAARMEGFDDDQIAKIEAAVPIMQKMIDRIMANQQLFDTLMADWKLIGPAMQIIIDAVAKRQRETS